MQSEFSLGEERRCEHCCSVSFELYARIAVNLVNGALVEDRRCVRSHDESHTASGDSRKTAHNRGAAAMSFSASARPWAAPAARVADLPLALHLRPVFLPVAKKGGLPHSNSAKPLRHVTAWACLGAVGAA
jgi:hypothetical protein